MDNWERAKTLTIALGLGEDAGYMEMIYLCLSQVSAEATYELDTIKSKYEELKKATAEWYHIQRGTMSAASHAGLKVGRLLGMSAYTDGKKANG